jgi:hypothetical protein
MMFINEERWQRSVLVDKNDGLGWVINAICVSGIDSKGSGKLSEVTFTLIW